MSTKEFGAVLFDVLQRLEAAKIWFQLRQEREDFIMIEICVPGERWEIEVERDGHLEIEIFKSDGKIHDEAMLEKLFSEFTD
jgi:hypothetical protein